MNGSPLHFASIALAATGLLSSCDSSGSTSSNGDGNDASAVSSPSFSPASGAFIGSQKVTLASSTSGATINYTTNGITPTTSSTRYTGEITVSATETIEAIAVKNGTTSAVASARFTIDSGTPSSTIPWNTSITYGSLTDSRDSNVYKTVTIGTQTWMAQNLNYAGTGAAVGVCYDSSKDSCIKFGRLYTWTEAMAGSGSSGASPGGVQGACPSGWHVPSDAEWTTLQTFVEPTSTTDGTKLKSAGGWYPNGSTSGNGTDTYGFRALPGGEAYGGTSDDVGTSGGWWSATESDSSTVRLRGMFYNYAGVGRDYFDRKTIWFSLRCSMDP